MFKCTSLNKIFVVCPASKQAGGIELLHQLVYALNELGLKAYITYAKIKKGFPIINPVYERYVKNFKRFEDIEDSTENIVIIPEALMDFAFKIKKAKLVIWWLSVDNYMQFYNPCREYKIPNLIAFLWYFKNRNWRFRLSKLKGRLPYNLAQSYYAIDFLKKQGFPNIEYLSDYINNDYQLANPQKFKIRKDVVLYNPKKGKTFSKFLMNLDTSLKWIPLINMNNKQIIDLLLSSKVYVDFGNHPGKDRFPREAAACGCCVITGKKGAAKYHKDVPIPEKYKFSDSKDAGSAIIACIKNCFSNFNLYQADYAKYRAMISLEYDKFNKDIKKIFLE